MAAHLSEPLKLRSQYVARVWGGDRLFPSSPVRIGEIWDIHEANVVLGGKYHGRTLAQLAGDFPAELLGRAARKARFPLLIKLLDCAEWLSVQVHPDDQQAARLEGHGTLGKTEAWHILEAEPGARLISGIAPGTSSPELRKAIYAGRVMEHVVHRTVDAGDSLLIPAGTVHALGPGILLYEVQQTSDVTYRIYDWDRPLQAGRCLHLRQSAEVCRPVVADVLSLPQGQRPPTEELLRCEYFVLERLNASSESVIEQHTRGQSFHALTVTQGEAVLQAGDHVHRVTKYESILLPAALGSYRLTGAFQALLSRLPH